MVKAVAGVDMKYFVVFLLWVTASNVDGVDTEADRKWEGQVSMNNRSWQTSYNCELNTSKEAEMNV